MNLQPLADRVIVKPPVVQTHTESGLIVQQVDRDDLQFVEVVAIGPDVTEFDVGDQVLVMESQSIDLIYENSKYWSYHDNQIIAVKE